MTMEKQVREDTRRDRTRPEGERRREIRSVLTGGSDRWCRGGAVRRKGRSDAARKGTLPGREKTEGSRGARVMTEKLRWEMTDGEISRAFRLAKDPVTMVEVLAGLNAVGLRTMKKKLRELGLSLPVSETDSRANRCWSVQEDQRLAELMDRGYSPAAAAARMPGRSPKSVYNRWRRLQERYLQERRV